MKSHSLITNYVMCFQHICATFTTSAHSCAEYSVNVSICCANFSVLFLKRDITLIYTSDVLHSPL